MEMELVPRAGYPFHPVRIRGFERSLGLSTLRTLASLPVAAVDAWRILSKVRPDCVAGVGAYASGPVVAEGAFRGVPAAIVEMDAHMGWTNGILSRLVEKVCLSFPDPDREGRKFVYTGRPLRPSLLAASRTDGIARFGLDPDRRVLLIFGGSLGARRLNDAALAAFSQTATAFQILHVAGQRDYARVAEALAAPGANPGYQAFAFLDDFPLALAAADAAVSRAGGSVAELLARGLPSLLVPYPFASADHQTKNAKMMAEAGAARFVPDADLDGERLAREVEILLQPDTNRTMAEAARRLARPDAASAIADVIVELADASGGKTA
jgi:UDP-N-acetylglucosamine--N-acetylmuramyl-(pentapeptide) pyrophosphoryl-undecaprenol N-acetylglucosamine transferase